MLCSCPGALPMGGVPLARPRAWSPQRTQRRSPRHVPGAFHLSETKKNNSPQQRQLLGQAESLDEPAASAMLIPFTLTVCAWVLLYPGLGQLVWKPCPRQSALPMRHLSPEPTDLIDLPRTASSHVFKAAAQHIGMNPPSASTNNFSASA